MQKTMTYREKKPCQDMLSRLVDDLRSKNVLCHVKDYPGVGLEELNAHVMELGPLENPRFGEQPAFFINEGRFIPYRSMSYGNALVALEISRQLGNWPNCPGGRVTSSPGAFILGTDVQMPVVAYTPRDANRDLFTESTWMYQGEPFAPTFVVEVDKLSGRGSRRSYLDHKMRNEYFQNGVKLGWLVDPRPDCHAMYVYYLDHDKQVQCSTNSAWRDFDGGDVLPGFRITSTSLDLELHRGERAAQKYLAKQKYLGV